MISLLHFSYFKRLVRSPIWPVCPKIHQTSPPQQLLNLLFQRKSPRYLTPTDFIKNRGLVKWCPRKDLVCPHRALSTMSFPHPHTTAFGRGFVEGPQVAEGALAAQVLTEEAEGYRTWVIGNTAAQLMACFQKKNIVILDVTIMQYVAFKDLSVTSPLHLPCKNKTKQNKSYPLSLEVHPVRHNWPVFGDRGKGAGLHPPAVTRARFRPAGQCAVLC